MVDNYYIGQYLYKNSFVHNMDAKIKFLSIVLYIMLVFFVDTYISILVMGIINIIFLLLAKIEIRKIVISMKYIYLFIIMLMAVKLIPAIVYYNFNDVIKSIIFGVKIFYTIMMVNIFVMTTTPTKILEVLLLLLLPLKKVSIAVDDIPIIIIIALRFIPVVLAESHKLFYAYESRNLNYSRFNIIIIMDKYFLVIKKLFINSLHRTEEITTAVKMKNLEIKVNEKLPEKKILMSKKNIVFFGITIFVLLILFIYELIIEEVF